MALALGACGEEPVPSEATSPTTIPASQSSQLQPSLTAPASTTVTATASASASASGHSEAPTSQLVAEQIPTLTPVSSSRAPDVDSTYDRRTPFVPLDQPVFLTAGKTDYLPDEDLVLGLEWMGEARAYPIRMITYHHIVNDTVAGRPLLVTY